MKWTVPTPTFSTEWVVADVQKVAPAVTSALSLSPCSEVDVKGKGELEMYFVRSD